MSPRRTCVACRSEAAPRDLLRLVASPGGELIVDLRARLPGRGAWVHPACVERLARRPAPLRRALRCDVDTAELPDRVRELVISAALDGLSIAAAAGALVGGRVVLEKALRDGSVAEVVVACDASERTVGALREAAPEGVPFVVVPVGRDDLGSRIGRGARAAVGVRPSSAARHLRSQLRRLRELG